MRGKRAKQLRRVAQNHTVGFSAGVTRAVYRGLKQRWMRGRLSRHKNAIIDQLQDFKS